MDSYILSVMKEISSKWFDTANLLTRFFFFLNSPESNSGPVQDKKTSSLLNYWRNHTLTQKKCNGNIFIHGWCLISLLSLVGDNEETLTFPPFYVETETCQQCFDPSQLHFLSCCSVCRSQRVKVLSVLSQIDPAKWAALPSSHLRCQ